jgi:tetratricopeptide (TPR) repeat protein
MRFKILISLLLFGLTLALYWPVRHFDRVNFDDLYFIANSEFPPGLNWLSLERAITGVAVAYWHPITSLSFLITHQFFGTNPGVEHLVNVLFHAANAALLFLVLLRLTGAGWCSAAVAAIFAWHPLRVESVAWIAERKDVLFTFFMLLSLLCYAEYAQPAAVNTGRLEATPCFRRSPAYILTLLFFILSFMCKAMLVTLPFLLLLLDFWPLQRFSRLGIRSIIVEKIPFFALTVLFSVFTVWIHKKYGDFRSFGELGLTWRLENATLNYIKYLGQFFWPSGLAILYPYPKSFNSIEVLLAALLLMAITVSCILELFRRPYLAVGWFWYLGMMVPVIGLVQFGSSPMSDRFTYIPLIGPVISMVWLVSEWIDASMFRKWLAASAAGAILAVCILLTREQMMFWQNTVVLFEHTAEVTSDNARVHCPFGIELKQKGFLRQAAVQYRIAMAIDPKLCEPHYRLGECLRLEGYQQAALVEYTTAISDGNDLGNEVQDQDLGIILWRMGRYREAVAHLEAALGVNPHFTEAMGALSWVLATCPDASIRDGTRAISLAELACKQTGYQQAVYISTLAAAYAEAGHFDEAVLTAKKAIALGQSQGETAFVQRNQRYLQLYIAHQPCRQNGQ